MAAVANAAVAKRASTGSETLCQLTLISYLETFRINQGSEILNKTLFDKFSTSLERTKFYTRKTMGDTITRCRLYLNLELVCFTRDLPPQNMFIPFAYADVQCPSSLLAFEAVSCLFATD